MADSEDVPVPISKPRRRLAGRLHSDLLQAREQLSSAPENDHRIDRLSHAQRAAAAAAECARQNRFEFERLPLNIADEKPPATHSNPDTRNQDVSDPFMQLRERTPGSLTSWLRLSSQSATVWRAAKNAARFGRRGSALAEKSAHGATPSDVESSVDALFSLQMVAIRSSHPAEG